MILDKEFKQKLRKVIAETISINTIDGFTTIFKIFVNCFWVFYIIIFCEMFFAWLHFLTNNTMTTDFTPISFGVGLLYFIFHFPVSRKGTITISEDDYDNLVRTKK